MSDIKMWCILVPTLMGDKFVRTRHHKEWDKYVRQITGGLTILAASKGQWVNPENQTLIEERIIPVHLACTNEQINDIINFTINHYKQKAVMYYLISDKVYIKYNDNI